MPRHPRPLPPLRVDRLFTEAELAAHALAAVHRVVGHGKPFASRAALLAALNDRTERDNAARAAEDAGKPEDERRKPDALLTPGALSAALALADPTRTAAKYDRGASVRRLLLRRLAGFAVADDAEWEVQDADPGDMLALPG